MGGERAPWAALRAQHQGPRVTGFAAARRGRLFIRAVSQRGPRRVRDAWRVSPINTAQ